MEAEDMEQATQVRWDRDVKCDLCGSGRRLRLRQDHASGSDFVRCEDCGLMFYTPRYEEQYVVSTLRTHAGAETEAEQLLGASRTSLATYHLSLLDEHIDWYRRLTGRDPDSLFQVGCRVGWYMKIARDRMMRAVPRPLVQGCEPEPHHAALARNEFGLDVRPCTFNLYPTIPDQIHRFALLAMLGCLEQSHTPCKDLTKLADLAAPGAILVLRTFLDELDSRGDFAHPILNAHHFTEATLGRALEQAGWPIHLFDKQREGSLGLVTVFAQRGQ